MKGSTQAEDFNRKWRREKCQRGQYILEEGKQHSLTEWEVVGFKSGCPGQEEGWIGNIISSCIQAKCQESPAVKVFNQKVQIRLQKKHKASLCQYCEAAKLGKQTNPPSGWI